MSDYTFNQNVVPLLQGLKPYLGSNGQTITEGILSLIKVVNSEHGREAVATMSKVITSPSKGEKLITVNTGAGPITFSLNMVFVLFLILILLILSGNLLALTTGSLNNDSWEPTGHEGEETI